MLSRSDYRVEFFAGESREYPGKACYYMLCQAEAEDGELVELYAEVLSGDVTETGVMDRHTAAWYKLKADIISQAKCYGIAEDQLEF